MMGKLRVIGVDPGTKVTGWGVIEKIGNQLKLIDYGVITPKAKDLHAKYKIIYDGIESVVKEYQPEALSVETQYVHKNVQSAIKLGMARGVIVVAAANASIPTFEYAPSRAKQAVTGKGNASKHHVQKMTKLLLGLSELPEPEDAADALALAIAHANCYKENLCTLT